jgi:hypothetical protein
MQIIHEWEKQEIQLEREKIELGIHNVHTEQERSIFKGPIQLHTHIHSKLIKSYLRLTILCCVDRNDQKETRTQSLGNETLNKRSTKRQI